MKEIKFDVTLEYSNDKQNLTKEFHQQPGAALMKRHNKKLKENAEC